jgi:hypothetical protein
VLSIVEIASASVIPTTSFETATAVSDGSNCISEPELSGTGIALAVTSVSEL